jgi:hypothetical protein
MYMRQPANAQLQVGKSGRRFFVGGNFKANGTLERIKNIIETLNKATINPEVGELISSSRCIYYSPASHSPLLQPAATSYQPRLRPRS